MSTTLGQGMIKDCHVTLEFGVIRDDVVGMKDLYKKAGVLRERGRL